MAAPDRRLHRAAKALGAARSFEVGLPVVGTAFVTVEGAIARAYVQAAKEDLEDWGAILAPVAFRPASVALEQDTHE